jgi:acylphosphatase
MGFCFLFSEENHMATAEEPARLTAEVYGLVQGVGFRYFVVHEASRLALRGYVHNTPQGSVAVVAEGSRAALEQLLQRLREGPGGAQVQHVAVDWGLAQGNYSEFRIRF